MKTPPGVLHIPGFLLFNYACLGGRSELLAQRVKLQGVSAESTGLHVFVFEIRFFDANLANAVKKKKSGVLL